MEILKLVLTNFTTIVTIIILVVKLVEYVQKALKEKNWGEMLRMVMKYMAEAEEKFDNGADRKEWVLSMMNVSAHTLNYNINMEDVKNLIDDLCKMSKDINSMPVEAEKAGE